MLSLNGNESFIVSSKDKLYFVFGDGQDSTVQIFKRPIIREFIMNINNNDYLDLTGLSPGDLIARQPSLVEIELKLVCQQEDVEMKIMKKFKPEDLYSLSELTKLSKIIARKLK